jgi:hypothetical protein
MCKQAAHEAMHMLGHFAPEFMSVSLSSSNKHDSKFSRLIKARKFFSGIHPLILGSPPHDGGRYDLRNVGN